MKKVEIFAIKNRIAQLETDLVIVDYRLDLVNSARTAKSLKKLRLIIVSTIDNLKKAKEGK